MVHQTDDTIAAIASAPGGAYRGIVRVAGSECVPIVSQVFLPAENTPLSGVRLASRLAGQLALGPPLGIVPADLLLWPGTRSYTRQPMAEFHTLGSPPLLDAVLDRLCHAGARIARPGEFTLRAFLAGRIDLTQAEAVLGVIDARDQNELDAALAQLAGGLAGPLQALRNQLLDLLAHLEAGLDFVEEDIEFISQSELDLRLDRAARQVEDLSQQMRRRGISQHLPRVVLCGEPNAGKSSLFNALGGADAAIVSEVAGTTRDYIARTVRCGNIDVELIDTAGISPLQTGGSVAAAAQAMTASQFDRAALVLVCIDASRPLSAWEQQQWKAPPRPDASRLFVLTKCDVLPSTATAGGIATSSRTGLGLDELKTAIASVLQERPADLPVVAGTAARCRESLDLAAESLRRAQGAASELGEEFVAAEVRAALDDLGRVVGAVYTNDVLDRIFSRFCIGK